VIAMSRIERGQFVDGFKADGKDVTLEVAALKPQTLARLKEAGIDDKALAKAAGPDRKISGAAEYEKLFALLDGIDPGDGAPGVFETADSRGQPTAAGKVHDALRAEIELAANRARVSGALGQGPKVATSDPHAQHVASVRAELKKEGLPTSAKGVVVHVIEQDDAAHAAAVIRTVAGGVGLAQGADVRLQHGTHQSKHLDAHPVVLDLQRREGGPARPTMRDYAKLGAVLNEATLVAAREEIRSIRQDLTPGGKTQIANLSWGASPQRSAAKVLQVIATEPDHPILRRARLEWAQQHNGGRTFQSSDEPQARLFLMKQLVAEIQAIQSAPGGDFARLRGQLETELTEARRHGLLVFNAAGNERTDAMTYLQDETAATTAFDTVKGLVTVGAADLKVGKDPKDDVMWDGSAPGKSIEIAAPGVNLPVGVQNNAIVKKSATSYAAPYAASVAALMVAANPKITPDQIEAILTSGRATTQLPGDRDGHGLLDPVKAVKEARKLATPPKP
jgi:hypothetical protein